MAKNKVRGRAGGAKQRRGPRRRAVDGALRRARAALAKSDLEAAAVALGEATVADPKCVPAHLALGQLLIDAGQLQRARDALLRVVALAPNDASGHASMATLHRVGGSHGAAQRCLERALELAPERLALWSQLGDEELVLGRLEDAQRRFEHILSLAPQDVDALVGLAAIDDRRGRPEAALARLDFFVGTSAATIPLLVVWGRACRRVSGREDEAEAVLSAALAAAGEHELISLGHVLGDLRSTLADHEGAFEAWRRANDARARRLGPHDAHAETTNALEAFSARALSCLPRARRDERPILIVGMPRSGTSLVEQIVSSHSAVHGAGELETMRELAIAMPRLIGSAGVFPTGLEDLTAQLADRMARHYLARLGEGAGEALRITDKMPGNYLYLGLAALLVPGARVIHCERDALDTCMSCYQQDFGSRLRFSTRFDWLGEHYRQYREVMAHWREVAPLPMHTVRYEELVTDPEATIRSLLEFCGLPFEEACLLPHRNRRAVATASYAQVTRPIHAESVGRSRRYGEQLRELAVALGVPLPSDVARIRPTLKGSAPATERGGGGAFAAGRDHGQTKAKAEVER